MSFRAFPPSVEALANDWAASVTTSVQWENLGPFGGSESKPFRVRSANTIALLSGSVREIRA